MYLKMLTSCFSSYGQAIGYDFDDDHYHRYFNLPLCAYYNSAYLIVSILKNNLVIFSLFHSLVHGRLPYQNLKPDPVLRNLLHSIPIRKVVRYF